MKKIINLLLGICLSMQVFAQASLPTSYNFDNFSGPDSLPVGWTTNILGSFTYASGQGPTGLACKLDNFNVAPDLNPGEYIQIKTANPIGTLSYYLKGYGTSPWTGTFKVQESSDETSWTDLASYTSLNSTTYQAYSVSPASSSRYVRFFFEIKVSGCNVGLDQVSATLATLTNREINVKQNGNTIFTGGSAVATASPIGTPSTIAFTIENLSASESLNVSSVTFTGANSSDYSIASPATPFTVNSTSNQVLNVTFNPSADGTRFATMNIASNDADESNYSIVLNCVGGSYATEPTNPATSLTFSNIKSYRYTSNLTGASGADGYLVVRKVGSAPTGLPVDGTTYGKGYPIGDGKVVYVGNAGSFSANEVVENTSYYFTVYSFNGAGDVINYLTSSALNANITSASNNAGTLYSGINVANATFVNDLHSLINPHTTTFYGNYEETMLRLFEARDTSNSQRVVTCIYSGLQFVYSEPFNWDVMSREHTYCHAWMPTNPADNPEKPEYNDQHHLFPAQFANANQVRLGWPLGEVSTVVSTYLDSKFGLNASGKTVFEPRDAHKGDAARALMYMCVAYNTVSGNNWHLPQSSNKYQDQNLLRKWHYQDPPSSYEKARNDFLDSLQGNRNPFIDHPEYACYIDFSNMTYLNAPAVPCAQTSVGNEELNNGKGITVLPNPSTGLFTIFVNDFNSEMNLEIYDVSGKIVHRQLVNNVAGNAPVQIDLSNYTKGVYILRATGKGVQFHSRLMVQ